MKPDSEGFLYAEIDQSLCVDCGACRKTCPQNLKVVNDSPLKIYALRSNDDKLLKKVHRVVFLLLLQCL